MPHVLPSVELACNPSSFAVYCGVRRSVLASFMQQVSASLCHRDVTTADSDDDDDIVKSCADTGTAAAAAAHRLPKVITH